MKKYPSFRTERLTLRITAAEDAPLVLALLNMPKWLKYIGERNVKSLAAAEQYIADRMTPQYERLGYGNYTVIRKADGVKMGTCGLYDREGLDGIDIGFAFLPAYEGKGYGYEAARRITDFAREELKMPAIRGITVAENIASRRLLEKLGMTFKEYVRLPDDEEKLLLYETGEE